MLVSDTIPVDVHVYRAHSIRTGDNDDDHNSCNDNDPKADNGEDIDPLLLMVLVWMWSLWL